MTTPPPGPRYRVVIYELELDGRRTAVMDATTSGFIAAATIQDGEMDIVLGDGGSPDLKRHIRAVHRRPYRA